LVIDLLLVLGSTENLANVTSQVILGPVFGLEDAGSHVRECWRRANLNEALDLVLLEEQVLRFDQRTEDATDMIATQQGEPTQASVAAQMHPNAFHPICKGLSRDVVMKCSCK